jgi:hypothetical protein
MGKVAADDWPPEGTWHVVARLEAPEVAARLEESPARALPGEEWRDRVLAELAVARVFGARAPTAGAAVVHAASACRIGIKTAAAPVAPLELPASSPLEVDFLLLARVLELEDACQVTLVGWTVPRVFRERTQVVQREGGNVRALRRHHLWPIGTLIERLRTEGLELPRYSSCMTCRVLLWPVHAILCGAAGCEAVHQARAEAAARG